MATINGDNDSNVLVGTEDDDVITGFGGDDTITGLGGNDIAITNVSTDGADRVNLGEGFDRVLVSAASTVRYVDLSFTPAEVGNGDPNDSGLGRNQDGGLAVRLGETIFYSSTVPNTSPISRYDDEGVSFISTPLFRFEVTDPVSNGSIVTYTDVVTLGTAGDDVIAAVDPTRINNIYGGQGNDTITAGTASDVLFGGDRLFGGEGDDKLNGGVGYDVLFGGVGNDRMDGGANGDAYYGGAGDDLIIDTGDTSDGASINVSTDGADTVNLGDGMDFVFVDRAEPGHVRLTFAFDGLFNGDPNDGGALANQDGGLAVRLQAEDDAGMLVGPVSRFDDEGVDFSTSYDTGVTFVVRDLAGGAGPDGYFEQVVLGSAGDDTVFGSGLILGSYVNTGPGDDVVRDSTAAGDVLIGGAGSDRFYYTSDYRSGGDTIVDFSKQDTFIVSRRLSDGNKDGLISFGDNGVLNLNRPRDDSEDAIPNRNEDTVAFLGLDPAAGLRFLGKTEIDGFDYYSYADASTRPAGAIEGTLADNMLSGTAARDVFFFDTALMLDFADPFQGTTLEQNFGDDRITGFGADDLLVTTAAIADANGDGRIGFGRDRILELSDGTSVTINDGAVRALEFDGSVTREGATYFVYSLVHSGGAGVEDLFG